MQAAVDWGSSITCHGWNYHRSVWIGGGGRDLQPEQQCRNERNLLISFILVLCCVGSTGGVAVPTMMASQLNRSGDYCHLAMQCEFSVEVWVASWGRMMTTRAPLLQIAVVVQALSRILYMRRRHNDRIVQNNTSGK